MRINVMIGRFFKPRDALLDSGHRLLGGMTKSTWVLLSLRSQSTNIIFYGSTLLLTVPFFLITLVLFILLRSQCSKPLLTRSSAKEINKLTVRAACTRELTRRTAVAQWVKIREIFSHLYFPRNDRKSDFRAYIWKYFGEIKAYRYRKKEYKFDSIYSTRKMHVN